MWHYVFHSCASVPTRARVPRVPWLACWSPLQLAVSEASVQGVRGGCANRQPLHGCVDPSAIAATAFLRRSRRDCHPTPSHATGLAHMLSALLVPGRSASSTPVESVSSHRVAIDR